MLAKQTSHVYWLVSAASLAIAVVMVLSGCGDVRGPTWAEAEDLCEPNGGLISVDATWLYNAWTRAHCKNGVIISFQGKDKP